MHVVHKQQCPSVVKNAILLRVLSSMSSCNTTIMHSVANINLSLHCTDKALYVLDGKTL